ncbi:TetR/AcrR family transcriptional regulator [Streptomyces oryzae]|uniref:TetR/AcrR family transcriptional regulator n=1 Tax=Streptomyces oryzae TaxID=1434886 RepID=A0ABS3XA16_9ACTN|nr:TetR family transcriptional regulator [Streptomyces oryzae]MBO8192159.1 TetR/AcrR family transcriptional regulator [Streptomyces oryzae]
MAATTKGPDAEGKPLTLRERKKLRTRQMLIDTALEQFTEHGFDRVTLDALCDAVEVSKRTFFRTFDSKEEVALAPAHDLWTAFLRELETAEPGNSAESSAFALLRDTLLATIERMAAADGGWAQRVRRSRRLAAGAPSIDAHGLAFCDRTSAAVVELVRQRFELSGTRGPQEGLLLRLTVDILVAAFRQAMDTWVADPAEPDAAGLVRAAADACAAVPESLSLRVSPR